MRILLTGAGGLIGKKIVKVLSAHEVIGVYHNSKPETASYVIADLSRLDEIQKIVLGIKPDVIVHAAALTDVDKCEENPALAKLLNVDVTKEFAVQSNKVSSLLVYVSTDYVFDGERGNYKEEDKPNPINVYGLTKLQGEIEVMKHSSSYLIVRTSTPYGVNPASGKDNFALWLIKKLRNKEGVSILVDQVTSPTYNVSFALMLKELLGSGKIVNEVVHLADASQISRYDFSIKLAKALGLNASLISPITLDKIKWKARRPRNSSLNVEKAKRILSVHKPLGIDEALKMFKGEFEVRDV